MRVIRIERSAHLHAEIESLAPKNLGIDRAGEFRQTVKALWRWSCREPIEIAIWSSDVAVRAGCDIDNDFSLWHMPL